MGPNRLQSLWVAFACAVLGGCAATERDVAPGRATGGMVAADHTLAAEAGAEILRAGGNAVDAAVATSFALSVVRPDACGIGGGGFMLVHLKDDPRHGNLTVAINYRETCPAAVGPNTYADWGDPEASRRGGRAVAVPGTVAGLLHALERYGSLERSVVIAPAIRLAERGFPADAHHVRTAASLEPYFEADASRKVRFPFVWERSMGRGSMRVGDLVSVPEQARALRLVAEHGADAFRRGPIADAMVRSVRGDGGVLNHADLAGYRVRETAPITHDVGGHRIVAMPPPSSGGIVVAQTLDLAERLNLTTSATGWPDTASAHTLAEILKHAFADRSRLMADPAFHAVPIGAMLSEGSLAETARSVRSAVDQGRTEEPGRYGVVGPPPVDGGTSHISVVDRFGNAVACTETINLAFGSLVVVDGFGFCLNNQMDDFTTVSGQANAFGLVQSDANLPQPGKRPLSSMSPTILLDRENEVVAVAGASGGPRIITSTAQVLLRKLRGGATADQAVIAPRVHHQWLPDRLDFEPAAPRWLSDQMQAIGFETGVREQIGAVQVVFRDPSTGQLDGAADPRKGGGVARE